MSINTSNSSSVPEGYCQCGCGQETSLVKESGDGYKKGQYRRYIHNHHAKGNRHRYIPEQFRFWSKVDIKSPNECWPWKASHSKSGYGRFTPDYPSYKTRRPRNAHHIAYQLTHGPVPDNLIVCHRCDNPSCCNPQHLFVGTNADNTHDMLAKGRHRGPIGNVNGFAKFTRSEIQEIRRRRAEGETVNSLAIHFKANRRTIYNIVHRRTWANIL